MSETNVEPTNCLDIIEQLRFDRDKYIGMWRSQCQITEQVMKERDRLTEQLNSKQDALSAALLALDNAVERCVGLEAELARYKQGVEVDGYISDDGLGLESISMWDYRKRFKKGQHVRVLVMKEVE